MKYGLIAILLIVISLNSYSKENQMTIETMVNIVNTMANSVKLNNNIIEFSYRNVNMTLIFDENADRMRIISPIMKKNKANPIQIEHAMAANFHNTLDIRYALSNNVIWSAFIHPLSDLSESLLISAIDQVAIARLTYGKTYSSGKLSYPRKKKVNK